MLQLLTWTAQVFTGINWQTVKDIIMKIELEQGDHDLDDLVRVWRKRLLKLTRVTHQHLAGSRLLIQPGSADTKTLLKY